MAYIGYKQMRSYQTLQSMRAKVGCSQQKRMYVEYLKMHERALDHHIILEDEEEQEKYRELIDYTLNVAYSYVVNK